MPPGPALLGSTKKLAFSTVDLLTDLLDTESTITTADGQTTVTVASGRAGALYSHLFKRPDGKQVLFVWDKTGNPTVEVSLTTRGSAPYKYGPGRNEHALHETPTGPP